MFMRMTKSFLPKPNNKLKEQAKRKLIGKISQISGASCGEALYLRPFKDDERMIAEIAKATGEKKSVVAQKLLHLALRVQPNEAERETRQLELLEWLAENEKHKASRNEATEVRLERLEEHARDLEIALQAVAANTGYTRVLASEIYCTVVVSMSLLNQIFTKIIEYFSPVEIEKKNSADFANRNILGLVEHSLVELENLSEHHALDLEQARPEMLYLFTKIEKIKARLLSTAIQPPAE
jgi:hypothetical protein